MNDGRKNVPFALPDDEDDDVFTSVDIPRRETAPEADAEPSPPPGVKFNTGPNPAVRAPGPSKQPGGSASTAQPTQRRPTGSTPAIQLPQPSLTVEAADISVARTVDVNKPTYLIGRDGADLVLPDEYVSDFHAQLRAQGDVVVLEDLGSENGVYLRIADEMKLEDHDEIVTGHQRFIFRKSWDPPPAPPTSPFGRRAPVLGGERPGDAARLIQVYHGGTIGGMWRIATSLMIGKQNADVCEPDDPWLSPSHAIIERRGSDFYIKDTNSQFGTFIRLLESVELIDGDYFVVGRTRIKITYP